MPRSLLIWALVLGALSCVTHCAKLKQTVSTQQRSQEAYVTLLYGDAFLLGVRVLGQSIRDTGSKKDLVVIVTNDVSDEAQHTLYMDGWRVKRTDAVRNPGKWTQSRGFPQKFWGVYTKLQIFNQTEYKKLVYLDADTIVMRNADVLFSCPGFCAALRHSERLNSGAMVVTPSEELYDDMLGKIGDLPSYTGGDQGFLNAYFADFANGFVFVPGKDYSSSSNKYMRLPTSFNADVGLYVVNSNRWMIPREDIYVLHYTLGPFKPWVWWNSWLVREAGTWEAIRNRLPPDSAGRMRGTTPRQQLAQSLLVLLPWVIAGGLLYQQGRGVLQEVVASLAAAWKQPAHSHAGRGVLPRFFLAQSIAVGYLSVAVGVLAVMVCVPPEVQPWAGWLLSYEWALLLTGALFGLYLRHCLHLGQKSALVIASDRKATAVRPWLETLSCTAASVCVLVLAPWAGRLLGVTSFVGTILATVFAALFANILLNHSFMTLPVKWYICGRSEGLAGK